MMNYNYLPAPVFLTRLSPQRMRACLISLCTQCPAQSHKIHRSFCWPCPDSLRLAGRGFRVPCPQRVCFLLVHGFLNLPLSSFYLPTLLKLFYLHLKHKIWCNLLGPQDFFTTPNNLAFYFNQQFYLAVFLLCDFSNFFWHFLFSSLHIFIPSSKTFMIFLSYSMPYVGQYYVAMNSIPNSTFLFLNVKQYIFFRLMIWGSDCCLIFWGEGRCPCTLHSHWPSFLFVGIKQIIHQTSA